MYGLGGAESFDHRRLPSDSGSASISSAHRQTTRDSDREPDEPAGYPTLSSRRDALWTSRRRPLTPRKSSAVFRKAHEEVSRGYGWAGRVNEVEGSEYFIARKEKGDIKDLWTKFLEKM